MGDGEGFESWLGADLTYLVLALLSPVAVVPLLILGVIWVLVFGIPFLIVDWLLSTLLGEGLVYTLVTFVALLVFVGVYFGFIAAYLWGFVLIAPSDLPSAPLRRALWAGVPVVLAVAIGYWILTGAEITTRTEFILMFTAVGFAAMVIVSRARVILTRLAGAVGTEPVGLSGYFSMFAVVAGVIEVVTLFFDLPGLVGQDPSDWAGMILVYILPLLVVGLFQELGVVAESSDSVSLSEFADQTPLFFDATTGEGMFVSLVIAFVGLPLALSALELSWYGGRLGVRAARGGELDLPTFARSDGSADSSGKQDDPSLGTRIVSQTSSLLGNREEPDRTQRETTTQQPTADRGLSECYPELLASDGSLDVGQVEDSASYTASDAVAVYTRSRSGRDGTRLLTPNPERRVTDAVEEAFLDRVRTWQTVSSHPNVCTVYEFGRDPQPWVLAENPAGVRLAESLLELDVERGLDVLQDTAEAVRQIGLYNEVHSNVSPSHIWLVDDDGPSVRVDDWGVERAVRWALGEDFLTPYTAPEQIRGTAVNERTDVYGLGAVAYHVLSERPPVNRDRDAILAGEFDPPSAVASGAERERIEPFDEPIMTALRRDADQRHRTVQAFKQALLRAERG
ncbi:protein kinase [Halovenus sp. WSH3]|uniref:Protein kinase n=1 Tax=Halovenus carboxidivorans TaxID=2692199 RepID=A0A6B0T2Y2_9EURY|nr:protein kinase [Halovenus carboxidivorans]MXR52434.1 protein kinase [Halovenus carboxidivorans]